MKKVLFILAGFATLAPGLALGQEGAGSFYNYQASGFAVPTDHFSAEFSASVTLDVTQDPPVVVVTDSASDLYRVLISRHPIPPNGETLFRFLVWRTDPENPEVVFDNFFLGTDNFANFADPTVMMIPYFAESVTDGVSFRLDGAQSSRFVHGTGEYSDGNASYRYVVSAHVLNV